MPDAHAQFHDVTGSSEAGAPEMTDVTFVGWVPQMPGSNSVTRKTASRLYHKKSRTGCQQCKARRVKVLSPSRSSLQPFPKLLPLLLVPISFVEAL
jgi:hypothetical protein